MNKTPQKFILITVLITLLLFGFRAYLLQGILLPILFIGILLGFVLYRSGICFAAMFTNMILFRDFSLARAVIIMTFVSFVGISLLQINAHLQGHDIPGRFFSVGVHTAAGGLLFGIGLVLAGSCAAGTLERIGEGFLIFWIVLFGMTIGSTLGASQFAWWANNFINYKPVFLPETFGWVSGNLISLIALGILFSLTFLIEKKNIKK